MALAGIAVVAVIAVSGNSASDSTKPHKDDVAPAAVIAAEVDRSSDNARDRSSSGSAQKSATATDAQGRTFSCSYAQLDQIDTAQARAKRRRGILQGLKAELAKLDKQYPGRTAPVAVADHYNALAARARAQVKWSNKAVREYNQLLVDLCDPS